MFAPIAAVRIIFFIFGLTQNSDAHQDAIGEV